MGLAVKGRLNPLVTQQQIKGENMNQTTKSFIAKLKLEPISIIGAEVRLCCDRCGRVWATEINHGAPLPNNWHCCPEEGCTSCDTKS